MDSALQAHVVAELDVAIELLRTADDTHWSDWLRAGRDQIAAGDAEGAAHVLQALGGVGSGTLSDVRLDESPAFASDEQRAAAEDRLWHLREAIWLGCRKLMQLRWRYQLLQISSPSDADGAWTLERIRSRLVEGGYEGLDLMPSYSPAPSDLTFLADLPRLRVLAVDVKVKNDLAAFALAGLHELALITGCKKAVPECVLPELLRLVLVEREGMECRKWPALEELKVGIWRSGGVAFLEGGTRLRHVELEGMRQTVALDGIETCEQLEVFWALDAAVEDLAPLRGLKRLRELRLVSRLEPHGSLDLGNLTSPALEKLWIGGATELRHVASLADLPSLREVRILDTTLTAADQAVLDELADRVDITVVT